HVARVQDEDAVSPDDLTVLVHHADAVGVAVERDADLGSVLLHGRDEVLEVLGDGRIRMVIWKRAIALAKKPATSDAQLLDELRRHERASAVTAIVHDTDRPAQRTNALEDVGNIRLDDSFFAHAASLGWGARPASARGERIEMLNLLAVQRG